MRVVLLLAAAFIPTAAFADPVSLVVAAVSAFTSTAFVIAGVAVSWGTIAFAAGSMLYGQAQKRKLAKRAADISRNLTGSSGDSFTTSLRDRTISGIATEFPARYVYGAARVGGNVVACFTSGDRDQYKHVVAVLCQHESHAITEIFINGASVGPLDASGYAVGGMYTRYKTDSFTEVLNSVGFTDLARIPNGGTVSVTKLVSFMDSYQGNEGPINYPSERNVSIGFNLQGRTIQIYGTENVLPPYTVTYQATENISNIRVITRHGAPNQPPEYTTTEETGGNWPLSATLQGHTYVIVRFNLDQPEFQNGLPTIEALVQGKPVLDLRSGVTQWSTNPALCIYDYLTGPLGGIAANRVPKGPFIVAANDCDDYMGLQGFGGPRYTFNGPITSDQSQEEVLETMAQSMAGGIVSTTWEIYAGKFRAPVMALYQKDVVGEIALSPGLPLGDIFNTVKGQFVSANTGWVVNDYPPYVNPTYLAYDGEVLDTNIDFPFTNEMQRCINLARIFTEDSRNGFAISARFSLKAWRLKIGQRVTFTSALFGQDAKVFRITDKSYAPTQGVLLSMKEDAESIYDLADEVLIDATPNTNLPNPFQVLSLTSVWCESGDESLIVGADGTVVSRIMVQWSIPLTLSIVQGGLIEIEWNKAGTPDWGHKQSSGATTKDYISPVEDGSFYTVRARCFNPSFNARSDWTYATIHKVLGKLAPPSAVKNPIYEIEQTGIRLHWTPNVELDIAGYEVRIGGASWETATLLAEVSIAAEYFWKIQASGTLIVWIKARDSSRNFSVLPTLLLVVIRGPAKVRVYYDVIGPDESITWDIPSSGFMVDRYQLSYGPVFATSKQVDSTKATGFRPRADYVGFRTWWVVAIDVAGNIGEPASITAEIKPPGTVNALRLEVIDNNALIYWTPPVTGTLPVEYYIARKGASFENGQVIGSNGNSTFTTVFEQQAGFYTYWIAAVDTAGNVGAPRGESANISQPPDYLLSANIDSALLGDRVNAMMLDSRTILVPVNTIELWQEHFQNNTWTSPSNQVAAGYPLYIQPTLPAGYYTEYVDYGALLPLTSVTVTPSTFNFAGVVNLTVQISFRKLPGDPWIVAPQGPQATATDFRYIRVEITFTSTVNKVALQKLNSLNIKLSTKRRNDSGAGVAVPGGTFVPFNYPFISSDTPIVQPNGSTPLIPVVIFAGVPNPAGFTVRLYNLSGVDVGGSFSWTSRGY